MYGTCTAGTFGISEWVFGWDQAISFIVVSLSQLAARTVHTNTVVLFKVERVDQTGVKFIPIPRSETVFRRVTEHYTQPIRCIQVELFFFN